MKYIKQFCVILAVTFCGEVLKILLPLPIPASIYGLVLLFLALELKIIKLEQVKDTGKYLIEVMPLMFIPAGVGLLDAWDALKPIWVQVVVIMLISTVVVMAVSGRVTQWVIRRKKGIPVTKWSSDDERKGGETDGKNLE